MAKFKAGDEIVHANGHVSDYTRLVIGYSQNGCLVYEYKSPISGWAVTSGDETAYKLKPQKKEGWINLYRLDALLDGIDRACGGLVFPTEQAAKDYPGHDKLSTIRIEWEE